MFVLVVIRISSRCINFLRKILCPDLFMCAAVQLAVDSRATSLSGPTIDFDILLMNFIGQKTKCMMFKKQCLRVYYSLFLPTTRFLRRTCYFFRDSIMKGKMPNYFEKQFEITLVSNFLLVSLDLVK